MRLLFFYVLILGSSISGFCQGNFVTSGTTTLTSEDKEWVLKQNVWSHAQFKADKNNKPAINFDAIDNWIHLESQRDVAISRDGRYFAYGIRKGYNLSYGFDTLVVQSTFDNWRQTFENVKPGLFCADDEQYIYYNDYKSELCFVELAEKQTHCLEDVVSYKTPANDKNEWLAYQLKNNTSTVVLRDLTKERELRFDSVSSYSFDLSGLWLAYEVNFDAHKADDKELTLVNLNTKEERRFHHMANYVLNQGGTSLVVKTFERLKNKSLTALYHVNLQNGASNRIWSTTDTTISIDNFSVDPSGEQVVFVLVQKDKSIWYWKAGMDSARNIMANQTDGIDEGLIVEGSTQFTDNGHYIQLQLRRNPDLRKPGPGSVPLDVWSYKDTIIQSKQSFLSKEPKTYTAIFNPENWKIIQVETDRKRLKGGQIYGDYAVILQAGEDVYGDRFWEKDYYQDSCWVLSLQDGSCKYVGRADNPFQFSVSPGNNYLVFADYDKGCTYFCYNLHSGKLTNISVGVPAGQFYFRWNFRRSDEKYAIGIAGWIKGDEAVLVYDTYDIWQLDLMGKTPARNITNAYGQSHGTELTFMNSDRGFYGNPIFSKKDTLVLRGFNPQNKYSGYYRVVLGSNRNPEPLFMGPYFFERLMNRSVLDDGMRPLKAAEASAWIVQRQTPREAANYFFTTDFKNYKQLTNLQPHKGYNWLTRELHSFKQLDGTTGHGVLTKPENFNPQKKYPVIIAFYASLTDQLNQYPNAECLDDPAPFDNPAWLVSHGYLVFTPDVVFTDGQWGPCTVNVVDAAARYLSKLPYVDGKHIAACGHSNSGATAYYVLTHSHLFAAMSIGAGAADVFSGSLSLYRDGAFSPLENLEVTGYLTGLGSFWKNKESWLDHTSVLHADEVNSPLLIFHCEKDANPVTMAIEMYISLRRMEKKVWWLQYDNGGHVILASQKKDQQDFTIRTTQFYDHYLKEAPAPRWMTQGVPHALKGIEARYELDPSGTCGTDCPICKAWNQQYKRTPYMFTTLLSEWKLDKDLTDELEKEEVSRYKINKAKDHLEVKNTVKRISVKRK